MRDINDIQGNKNPDNHWRCKGESQLKSIGKGGKAGSASDYTTP